ncbi:biotin--[acetyl-CoA-carboxylase] ligase [Halomicrococcus sp. SG-WS-1]|uniref:biotin--[acetyl-CoA-carboxylase] ligase n=1 Tax=Halomicrococcus sp. SG-WS-1 TaxID=3439057 RepID=UPI003F796A21
MNETRRAVLDALAEGPVAGPDLADRFDVSRNAVWKHVEALRDAGFEIHSSDAGYELAAVPEFGGSTVEYGLEAPFDVEYHDAIASTNDRARELAATSESDVVVLADEQTGGRGRLDREWVGPSGGVWLSLLVRPDVPPSHAPLLTLAAAVAVTRAAREAGVPAEIKWPNDVVVPADGGDGDGDSSARVGRKLAGILTEMEGEADRVSWAVVGVGVNANVPGERLPAEATSVQEESGPVERRVFVQRLLETFDELRADPDAVLPAWREYAATLGQRVRVETPAGTVEGNAVDVTVPGALVVETDEGRVHVHAGDCEHLRPA